jgi:hypothetical protein
VSLDELEPLRVLFGFFPTFRDSPLSPGFDRVLQVCAHPTRLSLHTSRTIIRILQIRHTLYKSFTLHMRSFKHHPHWFG